MGLCNVQEITLLTAATPRLGVFRNPGGIMIKQAIQALETNNWDKAHEIVQDMETIEAYWLHGIVHTLEGDTDNAQYWYRRAGRPFSQDTKVADEIKALKEKLGIP